MSAQPQSPRVISLCTRKALTLLEYRDRRGGNVSFQAFTSQGWQEVRGTATVLNLVLHRTIEWNQAPSGSSWSVSDPVSGLRVSSGRTRQDAMDDLALRVAYLGGETAFQAYVDAARCRSLN